MRIRSIRPEFWTSEDIAALDWPTRLIFIGLWSYVDDNGVGRDVEKLIAADLFPLEDDPHDTLMQVAGALKQLEAGGQITRYTVAGRPYLHITSWDKHQKVNRPSAERYPLPTCTDAVPHDILTEASVSPQSSLSAGEGEKGRRGEGEKNTCASTDVEREFDQWYERYPRKRGRGQALRAYKAARRKVTEQTLLEAVEAQRDTLTAKGPDFTPYPATWLNGERWADEEPEPEPRPHFRDVTAIPPPGLSPQEYADWEAEQRRQMP